MVERKTTPVRGHNTLSAYLNFFDNGFALVEDINQVAHHFQRPLKPVLVKTSFIEIGQKIIEI